MAEETKNSILEELEYSSGYDIALMTTFNFELDFFERAVLSLLSAKSINKVSVFIDSKELTEALNNYDFLHRGSSIGRKYMVNPIRINASFHPKVILLLGEKKARLFVSSANIKTSGYMTNNEIFNVYDYSENTPETLSVIVNAIDFFSALNDLASNLDDSIIEDAKDHIYYHNTSRNPELFLLHNLEENMFTQVKDIIKEPVKSVDVAVPYFDRELNALTALKTSFPSADFHIHIQNGRSTFPVEYNDNRHIVSDITAFDGFKSLKQNNNNFYHGKVFLFKTEDRAYVLYGSANCTMAALLNTYKTGGNIECDYLEIGEVNEFDSFFDNMEIVEGTEIKSQPLEIKADRSNAFSYKYGIVKRDIELHIISLNYIIPDTITLGDNELDFSVKDNEIIALISEEYRENLSDIFEVNIIFEGKTESLRCWAYNPVVLENARTVDKKDEDVLKAYDYPSREKYIPYIRALLSADITCMADIEEYNNNQKYMNQIKMEKEADMEEDGDYVVDYKIPDEYRYAFKRYQLVSRIRGEFAKRFFGYYKIPGVKDEKSEEIIKASDDKNTEINYKPRPATSDEKSFERFIKGQVRSISNTNFINSVSSINYIGKMSVLFDTFNHFIYEDPVEDIFSPDYAISTKISLLLGLLRKAGFRESLDDEQLDAFLCCCFDVIIENYNYYLKLEEEEEVATYESYGRLLLLEMEKQIGIRSCYGRYIEILLNNNNIWINTIGVMPVLKYIENLFGYKDYDSICKFIDTVYKDAVVEKSGGIIKISIDSNNIRAYSRPNNEVLLEIIKYSRNVEKISSVLITINNLSPNPNNPNPIVMIKHSFALEYRQLKTSEIRKNGDISTGKAEQIYF